MAFFYKGLGDFDLVNVNGAVGSKEVGTGKNAENRPTDVELIHFLLYRIYTNSKTASYPKIVSELLQIYGSPFSWNHPQVIKRLSKVVFEYQKSRAKAGIPTFPDGRVDKIRGDSGNTSITKTFYTLLSLQGDYSFRCSGKDDGDFADYIKPTMESDTILKASYPKLYAELFEITYL